MIEYVLYAMVFALSVIGLCDLVHTLWQAILRPKARGKNILVCLLEGEFADLQLASVIDRANWYGKDYADEIVAVDMTEAETSARCGEIAERFKVPIVRSVDLADHMMGVLNGKDGKL